MPTNVGSRALLYRIRYGIAGIGGKEHDQGSRLEHPFRLFSGQIMRRWQSSHPG
jgi:hypothetical protein